MWGFSRCTLTPAWETQLSGCSWDIHTTGHGCYGQDFAWALIPLSMTIVWQPQRRADCSAATKGLKQSMWSRMFVFTEWPCVWICFSLPRFSRRLAPTAGKTSTTTQSISFHTDTAPLFHQLYRARRNPSSLVMKVQCTSTNNNFSYYTEIDTRKEWSCQFIPVALLIQN